MAILRSASVLFLILVLFAACGDGDPGTDVDVWRAERVALENDIDSALDEIDSEMQRLEKRLAEASGETEQELRQQMDSLEERREELETALSQIGEQTEESWDAWSSEVEATVDDLD